MELWRKVWRDAIVPLLSDKALKALKRALETDDPRLIQGATVLPLPVSSMVYEEATEACGLSYCGVEELEGFGTAKVGDVEMFFAGLCFNIDQKLGEPGGCRHWLTWFDETPRDTMRQELLTEVNLSLEGREVVSTVCCVLGKTHCDI